MPIPLIFKIIHFFIISFINIQVLLDFILFGTRRMLFYKGIYLRFFYFELSQQIFLYLKSLNFGYCFMEVFLKFWHDLVH
jgi:hypothetical protein